MAGSGEIMGSVIVSPASDLPIITGTPPDLAAQVGLRAALQALSRQKNPPSQGFGVTVTVPP
jgi:hypothetical protein